MTYIHPSNIAQIGVGNNVIVLYMTGMDFTATVLYVRSCAPVPSGKLTLVDADAQLKITRTGFAWPMAKQPKR